MKKNLFVFSLTISALSFAQTFPNIPIDTITGTDEPTICVNPVNPNVMVAAGNIDVFYNSTDAGMTWSPWHVLSSTYGVYGDPCIIADTAGYFYYFHLAYNQSMNSFNALDRIVCQKSIDGGASFNNGSFTGLDALDTNLTQDKAWGIVDHTNSPFRNYIYTCWTQFDLYGTANASDSSVIYFSRSTDAGATWSPRRRISAQAGDCIDSDNTDEGAVPAVGPNGEIYISWAVGNSIVFNKSLDGGITWLPQETFVTSIPGGWDYSISGIYRANGMPVTLCDISGGVNNGTIYINFSDQRNGPNDADVWIVKSTDGGNTWSAPTRVNDDPPGKQQFFTWMTIDQSNGKLYGVFYDRRNYPNDSTDVYLAMSSDGGTSFTNYKISQNAFMPYNNAFIGDYTNISAVNNIIRPIWTRNDYSAWSPLTGITSIWTALVDGSQLTSIPSSDYSNTIIDVYPNPAHRDFVVAFPQSISGSGKISIFNMLGEKIYSENLDLDSAKFVRLTGTDFAPGTYSILVQSGNWQSVKKIVILH